MEEMTTVPPDEIVLATGDEVEIKFFYHPDLNESQQIRPDGKITLQLIGDVMAAGKKPSELKHVIGSLAEILVDNPEVAVIVRRQSNQMAYVGGSVTKPGAVPLAGQVTILAAIIQAGGFDPRTACVSNVVVIRHKDGQRYGCALDLRPALRGERGVPFYLEPNDIVYVPQTSIAQVNRWIDQHVNKIIPQLGLGFSHTSGNTTYTLDTSRDFFF